MIGLYAVFIAFMVVMIALDLGVFHRKAHVVPLREALLWSGVWIALACAFTGFIYFTYEHHWFGLDVSGEEPDGRGAAVLFFTGYVVEKMLSIDNVFAIAMIFTAFQIPAKYQHRVLIWGVIGALVMRAVMIAAGAALISRFHWVLYIFGVGLIITAAKMLLVTKPPDPTRNLFARAARRVLPVTDHFVGQRFITRIDGRLALTPLALALIVVEGTDLMFAVDSIPAIFTITQEPFLVFTSNVFAMMGLRALYFALAGILEKFFYLKISLAVLLGLIGAKMLLKDVLHAVPGIHYWSLGAIVLIIGTGVLASLVRARREARELDEAANHLPAVERGEGDALPRA